MGLLLIVVVIGACSDSGVEATATSVLNTEKETKPAARNESWRAELKLSGEIHALYSDVRWQWSDFASTHTVKIDGFDFWLYDREGGNLVNALTLSGIPYDVKVGQPLILGSGAADGIVGANWLIDAMNRSAQTYAAISGTLTFTRIDKTMDGEIEIQMAHAKNRRIDPDDSAPVLTITGNFQDVPAPPNTQD